MGQIFSCCCKKKSSNLYANNQKESLFNLTSYEVKSHETVNNLQHISERELADSHGDPSTNPTAGPLFVSKSFLNKGLEYRKSQINLSVYRLFKKSSSCSTIFLDDSTVSHPNLKSMIKCVAMAIYYHIHNRTSNKALDIFDEKIYPLEKTVGYNSTDISEPDTRTIYRFIRTLFNAAMLSSECAIITLVYLERLLTYSEIDILPSTWRRIVLAAILLASKVWDDQAVWNVDYCQILRDISVEDMNELERRFLELLQYNINVPSSVYVKYYFELRSLMDSNDRLTFPAEPLNDVRAEKLEAMSRACDSRLVNLKTNLKRWSSFDGIPFQRTSVAILS